MRIKIRIIKESDLLVCSKILEAAYGRPPYNEVFKPLNAKRYIKDKFKICKKNSFVVVDVRKKVIAFIFINISTWANGPQATIEEIVVDPNFQGNGVGKELLKYAHDYLKLKGVKSAMLWAKNDKKLLKFYVDQGYFLADDYVVMFKKFK